MLQPMTNPEDDPTVPRFVDAVLPQRFVLVDAEVREDASNAPLFGPFHRNDVIREPDGAIVFHEEGCLPLRFGVVRQEGDVLHLYPNGGLRVVPIADESQ